MPLKHDPLLEKLSETRDQLKQETKDMTGRKAQVCSDESLRAIAANRPLKRDDFKAIQGLGDAFIEQYADAFLRVIYAHLHAQVHEVGVSRNSKQVLSTYKDRLTNLSRRNRNLFMGRLANRHSIDLWVPSLMKSLPDFLSKYPKQALRLTASEDGFSSDAEETFHRRLTLLYREVNRSLRERGSSGLFIATPFIEGKLRGDDFEVKAPLLFIPVILKRKGVDFYLRIDHEKDVVFNRDLLLANQKASRLKTIENIPDAESLSLKTIDRVLIPFLEANHIKIKGKTAFKHTFEAFEPRKKDDFTKTKKGDLSLVYNVVLTMAKIHTSHMQEDINHIIEKETYNDLLETLLDQPLVPYDYNQANPFTSDNFQSVEEARLTAINDLNHSQEHVLDLIDTHDRLVVWGPPGTGKSQTITSLVAKQIDKGENVLVVSEKRVALDVIKNRLGHASPYAMFIDDAQDKQAFYKQVQTYLDPKVHVRSTNNDRMQADATINRYLQKLRRLHDAFYMPSKIGVPLSDLYSRYLAMKKIDASLPPERVYEVFTARFRPLTYDKLAAIESRFKKPSTLRDLLTYKTLFEEYPVLKPMALTLTRSEKLKRKAFYDAFESFYSAYQKAWFFNKPRLKRRFMKKQAAKLGFWFQKPRHAKKFLKALIEDETLFQTIKDRYHTFDKAHHTLRQMHEDEKRYLTMLMHDEPFASTDNVHRKHTMIFDALYTGMIEQFEAANQDKVHDIANYQKLMRKLREAMDAKRVMCEENFHMQLYKKALDFTDSKRIMDIRHKLESNRKMSVKSFIDRYQLELFSHINVWLMTPEVVSEIIPLNYAMFDLVIFDEASQLFVEKAVPTIYRAKKVVIAGDTKQLRPSALGEGRIDYDIDEDAIPDITLDAQSLLDLARYKYKETVLNYHYRSRYEELIAFSNHAFYDGRLIVSPNVDTPKKPPIETIVCEDGLWEQRANNKEADQVITLLKRVLREKADDTTVGVITFNTQQRNLIEDMIDSLLLSSSVHAKRFAKELSRHEKGEDHSLFVKNIENVQGDERDIIIFSTAYAKNRFGKFYRQFGWLNSEGGQNRLNVAITRAKQKVYIVTSFHPAELKVDDLKSMGPKRLKQYLEYCFHIASSNKASARELLSTLSEETLEQKTTKTAFKESILKRLEKEAFTVESDVGIGKETVDFALFTPDTIGKVGVICDVHAPHNSDVRESLYHDEKYLQARGWTIIRVFAPNWYKDANQTMRTIRNAVKALPTK